MSKTLKSLIKFVLENGEYSCPLSSYGPGRGYTFYQERIFQPPTPILEIIYGRPFSILPRIREKLKAGIHNHTLAQVLTGSAVNQRAIHKLVSDVLLMPTMDPVYPFEPKDCVGKEVHCPRTHPNLKGMLHCYPEHTHSY
uniref:Uncharacterized protein n=1 Tax=Pipistrellus kuhlii TaxID=59472 RepID=A0A7J8A9F1_PIPKU|nr:hypothetical protein mPipKuh1_008946 [Pipistrellus kuhlii]